MASLTVSRLGGTFAVLMARVTFDFIDSMSKTDRGHAARQLALGCGALIALVVDWLLFVAGRLEWWSFGILGLCCFVRSFNAMHALSHRRACGRVIRALRWGMAPVSGPLALGWPELARIHQDHHRFADTDRDPDAYLNQGPWWQAALHALTQPEQGLIRHVMTSGRLGGALARVAWNISFLAALAAIGNLRGVAAWLVVTRAGNFAAWFVFDWVLHQPDRRERLEGLSVPAPIRAVWSVAFGPENVLATCFHCAHHLWPWIPDAELPAAVRSRQLEGAVELPAGRASLMTLR